MFQDKLSPSLAVARLGPGNEATLYPNKEAAGLGPGNEATLYPNKEAAGLGPGNEATIPKKGSSRAGTWERGYNTQKRKQPGWGLGMRLHYTQIRKQQELICEYNAEGRVVNQLPY